MRPSSTTQANCVNEWAAVSAWAYVPVSGVYQWVEQYSQTMLGQWTAGAYPSQCNWSVSTLGTVGGVPANATRARMTASHWLESGSSKGTDGSDTFYAVTAGVSAGTICPPR